jgi:hypothetical protein
VREGAVAPAFLLDEYGVRRRRATLVVQIIELEAKLSDAAIASLIAWWVASSPVLADARNGPIRLQAVRSAA